MCKHHVKYEEKCTHVTQIQGQTYGIYLQAYMITKQRTFVSKQGHRQPHIYSKARVLSPQL